MALVHITRSLKEGNRLHAFLSGGGLRVIRIEKGKRADKLLGYGEHPHVDDALKLADETLRTGKMPKESVYLTGSSTAEGPLDQWLREGLTFDAWANADGTVVVQLLNSFYSDPVPQELLQKAHAEGTAEWRNRGGIHLVHSVSYHPNRREHRYDYGLKEIKRCTQNVNYPVAKTGKGADFDLALAAALAAPQLEVEKQAAA